MLSRTSAAVDAALVRACHRRRPPPDRHLSRRRTRAADVFHHQEQMQGVSWGRLELRDQMQVEGSGVVGFGVNQQAPAADSPSRSRRSPHDVCQESCPQPLPFVAGRHSEPREQCDRLRTLAGTGAQPVGRVAGGNARHAPGVVSDHLDAVGGRDHEHPCRAGRMGLAAKTSKPARLRSGSAGEARNVVRRFQQARRPVPGRHSSTNGDGRDMSDRKPTSSRAGRRFSSSHARRPSSSSANSVRSTSAS